MILRPYQEAARTAVYEHLRTRDDHTCVVMPTGSGKSPLMAALCKDAVLQWNGRVLILAHVKELLEQAADKLLADPVTLADVLFVLCQDEAAAKSITEEDFGRALGGDALALAAEAFVEELVDFFPDARARTGLRRLLAAGKQVGASLLAKAEATLDRLDPEAEATAWLASRTNSPGSPASSQDPSRSANSS